MSTPSSPSGAEPPPPSRSRDLRDSWLFRLAALGVVLLAALLVARGCASAGRDISQEKAIEIARSSVDFTPDKVQVRFVQQGIPARALWAVSLYTVNAQGRPDRAQVVLIDTRTGAIVK